MFREVGIAVGVVALTVGVAASDPDSGIRAWWSLRADSVEVSGRIDALREQIAQTEAEIRGLRADPLAQERAIREDLGFARPGETVVRLRGLETGGPLAAPRSMLRLNTTGSIDPEPFPLEGR